MAVHSQFMHLCEDELTSTSQTSLTHADECLGTKVQLYMSHDPVCSPTGGSFILSSHVIHASSRESTCAFWAAAHIMCAGLVLPAPRRPLGLSCWSSCSCLQHVFATCRASCGSDFHKLNAFWPHIAPIQTFFIQTVRTLSFTPALLTSFG